MGSNIILSRTCVFILFVIWHTSLFTNDQQIQKRNFLILKSGTQLNINFYVRNILRFQTEDFNISNGIFMKWKLAVKAFKSLRQERARMYSCLWEEVLNEWRRGIRCECEVSGILYNDRIIACYKWSHYFCHIHNILNVSFTYVQLFY